MVKTADIASYEAGIETFVAFLAAVILALKKLGYYDRIVSKLKIPSKVADNIHEQGSDAALSKLQIPDDILCILGSFEINDEGKIVLKGQGRVNTLLKLERELSDSEKDEIIKVVKRVLLACSKE